MAIGPIAHCDALGYRGRVTIGTSYPPRTPTTSMEPDMRQPSSKDAPQKVCAGCGTAAFLLYSIRTGEPAIAVERAYCSVACARLHFPAFTPPDAGR